MKTIVSLLLTGLIASCQTSTHQKSVRTAAPEAAQASAPAAEDSTALTATTTCTINQPKCVSTPSLAGSFLDTYGASTNTTEAGCFARAKAFAEYCQNPAGTTTTATFVNNGATTSTSYTVPTPPGCSITQSKCNVSPSLATTFQDTYSTNNKTQDTCFARARAFAEYCQNPPGSTTTATFTNNGNSVSTSYTVPTPPGCAITQTKCNVSPGLATTFQDTYSTNNKTQETCFARAKAFAEYCQNPPGSTTTATFTDNGASQSTTYTVPTPPGCAITQTTCAVSPSLATTFQDTYSTNNKTAATCFARAQAFAEYCQNAPGSSTTATFTDNGVSQSTTYTVPTPPGCSITQTKCNVSPNLATTFQDTYSSNNKTQDTCFARAKAFAEYCQNPPGSMTTATFTNNGTAQSTTYTVPTPPSCTITQTKCQAYPNSGLTGTFKDTYVSTNNTQAGCFVRAKAFADYCQNQPGVTTTATFTDSNGTPQSTSYTVPLPNGCSITQSQCVGHPTPNLMGTFQDTYVTTNNTQAGCFVRAKAFADYCRNPFGSTTTATFTANGSSTSTTYTVVPLPGCMISQGQCVSDPTDANGFFGTFLDPTGGDLDTTQAGCFSRAKAFSDFCKNPEGSTTTATWTANGNSQSTTFTQPPITCKITQSQCVFDPNPGLVGTFNDTYGGPTVFTSVGCGPRAKAFALYCKNPLNSVTSATFSGWGIVETTSYKVTQNLNKCDTSANGCFAACSSQGYGFSFCQTQCGNGDGCFDACAGDGNGFSTCNNQCASKDGCFMTCVNDGFSFGACQIQCANGDGCYQACQQSGQNFSDCSRKCSQSQPFCHGGEGCMYDCKLDGNSFDTCKSQCGNTAGCFDVCSAYGYSISTCNDQCRSGGVDGCFRTCQADGYGFSTCKNICGGAADGCFDSCSASNNSFAYCKGQCTNRDGCYNSCITDGNPSSTTASNTFQFCKAQCGNANGCYNACLLDGNSISFCSNSCGK